MNTIDWSTYKFHCSGLANLMVTSRKKDEVLSETTKSWLRDIYIREVWGRQKLDTIGNKYMEKGTMCETDTIELVERVFKAKYFKNQEQLENDFIVGTPDIKKPVLIDVKTSWDLFTFAAVDAEKAKKDYYYQMLGYMWLTGFDTAQLVYGLVDTPEEMMNDELYKMSFKVPEEVLEPFKNNYSFSDVPEQMRVKSYEYSYSQDDVDVLIQRIEAARNYLSVMTL